jgi:hypothetical protein
MLGKVGYSVFVNDALYGALHHRGFAGFVGAGVVARTSAIREPGKVFTVERIDNGSERGVQWARFEFIRGKLVAWVR